jgi:hypothetical protein
MTIVKKYLKGIGRVTSKAMPTTTKVISGPGLPSVRRAECNWKQEIICEETDGTLASYALLHIPLYGSSLSVYINGLLQRYETDYTFSENIITFNSIIPYGFNIVASYIAMQMEY